MYIITWKGKVPVLKVENNIHVVDNNNNNSSFDDISDEDTIIKCWIYSDGLWKYDNKFGMSWKIKQVKINTFKNTSISKDNSDVFDENNAGNDFTSDADEDNYEGTEEDNLIPNFELETDPQFIL